MTPYSLRPYTPDDEDFVVYSWLKSYAHSKYGQARGAQNDATPQEVAYWEDHRPLVMRLLATCEVTVACDAKAPGVVWGWACCEGDVVHYVLVKRAVHQASAEKDPRTGVYRVTNGLSGDIYRALLGARLATACAMSHELADFKRAELRAQGVTLPASWYLDSTLLGRSMIARAA